MNLHNHRTAIMELKKITFAIQEKIRPMFIISITGKWMWQNRLQHVDLRYILSKHMEGYEKCEASLNNNKIRVVSGPCA